MSTNGIAINGQHYYAFTRPSYNTIHIFPINNWISYLQAQFDAYHNIQQVSDVSKVYWFSLSL